MARLSETPTDFCPEVPLNFARDNTSQKNPLENNL
jgi:hypothetical protein